MADTLHAKITFEVFGKEYVIAENKKNLVDMFGRNGYRLSIKMPSGPRWLLDNKDRYPDLWIKTASG